MYLIEYVFQVLQVSRMFAIRHWQNHAPAWLVISYACLSWHCVVQREVNVLSFMTKGGAALSAELSMSGDIMCIT